MERDGIVFLDETIPREYGYPDWYQNTWHAPWYIFEHWGRWFDIRAYIPGGALGNQELILLQRRSNDTPHAPIAARPAQRANHASANRVADALSSARVHRHIPRAGGRSPKMSRLARQLVLRILRPYTFHEDQLDDAVATSIAELTDTVEQHAKRLADLEAETAAKKAR
jgi:hypothetical protein